MDNRELFLVVASPLIELINQTIGKMVDISESVAHLVNYLDDYFGQMDWPIYLQSDTLYPKLSEIS